MSANEDITALATKAKALLKEGKPDKAIDILRIATSNEHPELAGILAHCYYKRGDARGDVHASTYFAKRAIELGNDAKDMHAIVANGNFRKGKYAQSLKHYEAIIDEESPDEVVFLYIVALHFANRKTQAKVLLKDLINKSEDNKKYQEKFSQLVMAMEKPAVPDIEQTTGGVKSVHKRGVKTAYKISALSVVAGYGDTAKDFNWVDENVPCQQACPAHTDIPGYLAAILNGNFREAYEINLRDNVFPGVLGRVCSRPCEAECRHGWDGLGESVAICWSKRSAADLQVNDLPVVLDKLYPDTGKRIAVVGAGPAGLAVARDLARLGHKVIVFERHEVAGGMLEQGIPIFRLPRDIIDREIKQIELLDVDIMCNVDIGKDETLTELRNNHDAVILAAGTLRPNYLKLPGADLEGISHGLDYLLETNHLKTGDAGKKVLVIGGGFTAMDCSRTAKRLGTQLEFFNSILNLKDWRDMVLSRSKSNVRVLYRRSASEMLVTPGEIDELEVEDISMEFLISPMEYLEKNGHVAGMKFIQNVLGEPDEHGRRRPVPVENSEFVVPADQVVLATGQFPETHWIDDPIKKEIVGDDGWLNNSGGTKTSIEDVFIAGDYSTGAKTIIEAIAHGKQCALDVDEYLMKEKRMKHVVFVEDTPRESGRNRDMDFVPLQDMPMKKVNERAFEAEVEEGYDPELAIDEAQRCYQCNYKYEIDPDVCIYCNWCIKAKPRPDCIVEVSSLIYGDKGEIKGFNRSKSSEETTQVYINQADCIRCGACVDACPVDAISVQKATRGCADKDDVNAQKDLKDTKLL